VGLGILAVPGRSYNSSWYFGTLAATMVGTGIGLLSGCFIDTLADLELSNANPD